MTSTIKSLEVMIDHITQVSDLLHQAITDSEWCLVSEAYYILCGEHIDIPERVEEDDTTALLKQMMSRLDSLENNKEPVKPKKKKGRPRKKKVEEEPTPKAKDDFTISDTNRSRKVSDRVISENKFEEMEDVISEAGRDNGFDQINDKKVNRKRNTRKKYKQASVTCGSCNNTFEVNPMFVRENYTCDGCLSRRG